MGSGESKLSSLYEIKEITSSHGISEASSFDLHRAVHKESGRRVSVFIYKTKNVLTDRGLLHNAVKRLKTIRHPGIIKFHHAELHDQDVVVVTEPVTPLSQLLSVLPPEERAVSFLHSQRLVHNNIQLSSIYVSDSMFFVDYMHDEFLMSDFNQGIHEFIAKDQIPPEDSSEDLDLNPVEARDSYSLGFLISYLIAPYTPASRISTNEKKGDTVFINWAVLQGLADRMVLERPRRRLKPKDVMSSSCFEDNVLIQVIEKFLKQIRGYPLEQKEAMFASLPQRLSLLPPSTLAAYALPYILSVEMFLEPQAFHFYQLLLGQKYNTTVPEEGCDDIAVIPKALYIRYVIPYILKLFKLRSYDVRITLLKLFHNYIDLLIQNLDRETIRGVLVPELLVGLEEQDDSLYLLSLTCLISAAGHLMRVMVESPEVEIAGKKKSFEVVYTHSSAKCFNELKVLVKSVSKCIQLMIKIASPETKIELMHTISRDCDHNSDAFVVNCIPQFMEILVSFLTDGERDVRRLAANLLIKHTTALSNIMELLPAPLIGIDKSGDAYVDLLQKLRHAYRKLSRDSHIFQYGWEDHCGLAMIDAKSSILQNQSDGAAEHIVHNPPGWEYEAIEIDLNM
ncbi:uncharacterized protein BJ171DRAFT_590953 [Polychytrium aggregatum]|uniref:uncharacterized protein n=1 Tax=Polychytrium aggregatum TaxID=110093 RepID=UPI0022FF3254|nr:uncharacterized protein BJ171DRAFT_590953 [Polychytrium aggregatum]KAI9190760.1 hypothetical protein BJ171DRAFT_590953 [Polychytrium aggregatum]